MIAPRNGSRRGQANLGKRNAITPVPIGDNPAVKASLDAALRVIQIEQEALAALLERLQKGNGGGFEQAVELMLQCRGRVVVTGMGKSGLIARKISATLVSTGTPALFLHPAEAAHGDLGMMAPGDLLLVLSYGGNTEEIEQPVAMAKRLGLPVLAMTGNRSSTLAQIADAVLDARVEREACPLNLTPTASTTAMMALGDALAIALLERRGFTAEDFARLHPGGSLGKKLQRVESLMRTGEAVPRVGPATPTTDAIYEMSRKGLGMTAVVAEDGRVAGIVTDGDLRRLMQQRKKEALDLTCEQFMTRNPATVEKTEFAATALRILEDRKITSLLVVDPQGRLEGVLHLHDLWTTQLF
jgi:arabinose-5-phosphate isomerase